LKFIQRSVLRKDFAGKFTDEEKEKLLDLVKVHGTRFSIIGKLMNKIPGTVFMAHRLSDVANGCCGGQMTANKFICDCNARRQASTRFTKMRASSPLCSRH